MAGRIADGASRPQGWLGRLLRRRPSGIRVRLTLLAVLVVAAGLLLASVVVLALVRNDLSGNARSAATERARDAASELTSGVLPALPNVDEDRPVLQIVDEHGTVLAASPELRGRGPLLPQRPTDHAVGSRLHRLPIGDGAPYWAVGLPAHLAGRPVAVYAAASLEPVGEGVDAALSALLVVSPVILIVAGGTAWLLVGRALRPVEAMRRQVAEITSGELDLRVPEPPGTDEIGRLARTMNAMLERLQQAGERQRRFVSDASHELRSPLAAMRTRTEVGLAHPAATDWPVLARDVHREVGRLDQLVEELLALSRAGAGNGSAPASSVDLDELLLTEVEAIRARGRVNVDLSGLSPVRVQGHPQQLRAVVRNLLDNAERHARTRIAVRLFPFGEEDGCGHGNAGGVEVGPAAELVVADDGPGVAAAHREQLFDRFFRVQSARDRNSGGVGLGLAIVRDVVTTHGGRVWIADPPGGAEFHVRLPMIRPGSLP
ncbi:sensor histidine kinase [Streptomyces sp. NPDC127066]|uniref:sensor histidine kinase n=1 Tax=Streptomyces sp. NPDC127066 TaxID=3347125 RepID=UPI003668003E